MLAKTFCVSVFVPGGDDCCPTQRDACEPTWRTRRPRIAARRRPFECDAHPDRGARPSQRSILNRVLLALWTDTPTSSAKRLMNRLSNEASNLCTKMTESQRFGQALRRWREHHSRFPPDHGREPGLEEAAGVGLLWTENGVGDGFGRGSGGGRGTGIQHSLLIRPKDGRGHPRLFLLHSDSEVSLPRAWPLLAPAPRQGGPMGGPGVHEPALRALRWATVGIFATDADLDWWHCRAPHQAWTKWPTYGRRSGRSQLDSPRLPSPRCRRPIQMRRRLAGPSRPASRRASGPASGRRSSFGRPQGVAACCRRASKQEGVRAGTCGNAMRTLPHAAMAPATRPI